MSRACVDEQVGLPVILDTDIGGEPDDAMSLFLAARELPGLALVVTSDEVGGQRARFARFLLDSAHRPDVQVVAGRQLSATPSFFADGLTPATVADQPADVAAAVTAVCERSGGARWVGLGPLSNLATVLAAAPGLGRRLHITQLAGTAGDAAPALPQRNFRLDMRSARAALTAARQLRMVVLDGPAARATQITSDSPVVRQLADAGAPAWPG